MILYPAIDLMDGRCVRLRQGRFDDAVVYPSTPAEALARYAAAGASWAHIVDLDGAREGAPRQHALLAELASASPLSLQVAGGIREPEQVERLLDAAVSRVVIGSLAVREPTVVSAMLDRFGPERITLALDVRLTDAGPLVAVSGWAETTDLTLWSVVQSFPQAKHLLVTDIGRDGMLQGPNLALLSELVERLPGIDVQASGGVTNADDLGALAAAGAAGAVVGKALWEGRFTLEEALAHARG